MSQGRVPRGLHETAHIETFSWGIDNKLAHICVPRSVERAGCGYMTDRRPASNMDPYVVTSLLSVERAGCE
ncbi:hypothetical protein T484DRAFT_1793729 [Baffinella frigidus]|nr:hypothetical protein T484DRAFT_1793729 [Cryptophyta sp. CCMP2293]